VFVLHWVDLIRFRFIDRDLFAESYFCFSAGLRDFCSRWQSIGLCHLFFILVSRVLDSYVKPFGGGWVRSSEDFRCCHRASALCPSLNLVFHAGGSLRFVTAARLRSDSSSVSAAGLLLLVPLGVRPWRCMNLFAGSHVRSTHRPMVSLATDSALVLVFFGVGSVVLHSRMPCSVLASALTDQISSFVAS
jgi:hypothetical protein